MKVKHLLIFSALWLFASAAAAAITVDLNASRTSGKLPLTVRVDAVGTDDDTITGTTEEWRALTYYWDCGDASAGTWAIDGSSKRYAIGPEAVCVYTTAGTYTISLTAKNAAGTTASATVDITVSDWATANDTWCVCRSCSAADGGNGFPGCPNDANADGDCKDVGDTDQCEASSDFDAEVASRGAAGKRLLFKAGDTFDASTTVTPPTAASQALLGAFGSGAKPIVDFDSANMTTIMEGINQVTNWTITGLHLHSDVSGVTEEGRAFGRSGSTLADTIVYDVQATGFGGCYNNDASSTSDWPRETHVVDFVCEAPAGAPQTSQTLPTTGSATFSTAIGFVLAGYKVDMESSEFLLRINNAQHALIYKSEFLGNPIQERNPLHFRGCNTDGHGGKCNAGADTSRYVYVADNMIQGWKNSSVIIRHCDDDQCGTTGANKGQQQEWFTYERNQIKWMDDTQPINAGFRVFQIGTGKITVRDNIIDLQDLDWPGGATGINIFQLEVPDTSGLDLDGDWFIGNTIYMGSGYGNDIVLCDDDGTGASHVCANNLLYAPSHVDSLTETTGAAWDTCTSSNDMITTPNPFDGTDGSGTMPTSAAVSVAADFKLNTGVAQIDTGCDLAALSPPGGMLDYFEECRPEGSDFDVGAHEYGAATCSPFASGSMIFGSGSFGSGKW